MNNRHFLKNFVVIGILIFGFAISIHTLYVLACGRGCSVAAEGDMVCECPVATTEPAPAPAPAPTPEPAPTPAPEPAPAPVGGGEPFQPEGEGWVLKPHALGAFLEGLVREGGAVTCLARQHDQVVQGLAESLPRSLKWQLVPGILVGPIARLALRAQREGKLQESSQLDAYYIRRPDAELNWRG